MNNGVTNIGVCSDLENRKGMWSSPGGSNPSGSSRRNRGNQGVANRIFEVLYIHNRKDLECIPVGI